MSERSQKKKGKSKKRKSSESKSSKQDTKDKSEFKLTECQEKAFEEIKQFLDHPKIRFYVLTGAAGTGKTFLMGKALLYAKNELSLTVAGGCPTHKAKFVLQEKVKKAEQAEQSKSGSKKVKAPISVHTVQHLLRAKLKTDFQNGTKFCKPHKDQSSWPASQLDLLVVDESSMVEETMAKALEKLYAPTKVLFIGDRAQLPPINELVSRIFADVKYGCDLKTIVRYDSDILVIAEKLRDVVKYIEDCFTGETLSGPKLHKAAISQIHSAIYELCESSSDDTNVFMIDSMSEWKTQLIKTFKEQQKRLEVTTDRSDDAEHAEHVPVAVDRILAWRNARCLEYNKLIRRKLYGSKCAQFVETEILVTSNSSRAQYRSETKIGSYTKWTRVQDELPTNTEIIIRQCKKIEVSPFDELTENNCFASEAPLLVYNMYEIIGELVGSCNPVVQVKFNTICDGSDRKLFDSNCVEYKKWAIRRGRRMHFAQAQKIWDQYDEYANLSVPVLYANCLTVHKSQGSTFQDVFVDLGDICRNNDAYELTRCVYTAITRASRNLYFGVGLNEGPGSTKSKSKSKKKGKKKITVTG